MISKIPNSSHVAGDDAADRTKKPYSAPRILSREKLESAANVCTGFGQKNQAGEPAPGGGLCGQSGLHS